MKKTTAILLSTMLLSTTMVLNPDWGNEEITWGATFSQKESQRLNGEWQEPYREILDELRPSKLRLIGYWDLIEPTPNNYNFEDLDLMMKMAEERNIPVILAIGQKTPRWPECHVPEWAETDQNKEEELLDYLDLLVNRYKNSPSLTHWQVENEPFLGKENCSPSSEEFFEKEINLVRDLDNNHPIFLADSGELGDWERTIKYADDFGFTLYHKVYDDRWGTFEVNRSTQFFKEKMNSAKKNKNVSKIVCIELGMEPWGKVTNERLGDEQFWLFTEEDLEYNLRFAKKMSPQVDEFYFWGAEWWYYAKENGHPEYWNKIRQTMDDNNELI